MRINVSKAMDKTSLCKKKRETDINVENSDNEEFLRTKVTRKAIFKYKNENMSREDVLSFVDEEMSKIHVVSETTRRLQIEESKFLINKYLDEDDRTSKIYYPKEFAFKGHIIYDKPDFVYFDEAEIVSASGNKMVVPVVEVVKLTVGRQKYVSSNNYGQGKCTTSIHHNIDALGSLLYGKHLLGKKVGIVRIVFDGLKTSNDKNGDFTAPWSEAKNDNNSKKTDNRCWMEVLLNEQGNIENFKHTYDFKLKRNIYDNTKLYNQYFETIKWYANGTESCAKETCKKCELYEICHYNHRPKKKEKKIVQKNILAEFNITEEQQRVIDFKKGIAVVDAGPGSGKTQSMALRTSSLLVDGVNPKDIIIISFSKAAVEVILNRVKQMVEEVYCLPIDVNNIKIATFNSLGNEIIKKYYKELGFKEEPQLIDDIEKYDLILKSIDWDNPIEGYDYKNPNMSFGGTKGARGVGKEFQEIFQRIRDFNIKESEFVNSKETASQLIWDTYVRYENLLKENNYIDYSDQSNLVSKLMEKDDYFITNLFRYEHIIVDEFQDSDNFQMEFLKALINTSKFKSLLVVGDDAQAIYGFRGTTPENIINFEEKIEESVEDLYLTINHRSSSEIVELSNEIIMLNKNQIDKHMTSSKGTSGNIPLFKGFDKRKEELDYIANNIELLIKEGVKPEEIAVISFKKSTLNSISSELAKRNILSQYDMDEEMLGNSRVIAGIGLIEFVNDTEATKGLMLYLNEFYENKLLEFGSDKANSLIEINKNYFEQIYPSMNLEQQKTYLLGLLEALDDGTDNIYKEFLKIIKEKSKYNVGQLISYIIKFKKYESEAKASKKGEYEAVALVTAHSSKGKEWKYVFGTISDFDKSNMSISDIEEKRRLIFVMVTRAKDFLTVTSLRERNKDEGEEHQPLNRFYAELRLLNGFNVVA